MSVVILNVNTLNVTECLYAEFGPGYKVQDEKS
jgi:hypothetical protein